jgi:hypothetical protein
MGTNAIPLVISSMYVMLAGGYLEWLLALMTKVGVAKWWWWVRKRGGARKGSPNWPSTGDMQLLVVPSHVMSLLQHIMASCTCSSIPSTSC